MYNDSGDPIKLMNTISNIRYVGTTPGLSMRLFEMADDPFSNAEDIARIIAREPSLSAQILKIANSVHFAQGHPVNSISEAVVRLGTNRIRRLAYSIELLGLFQIHNPTKLFDEKAFYRSSLAGAVICNRLAFRLEYEDLEAPFIAGLLRDFGVLMVKQYLPNAFIEIWDLVESKKWPFAEACKAVVCFDPRYISYLLLRQWGLPDRITYSVEAKSAPEAERVAVGRIEQLISHADSIVGHWGPWKWDRYAPELKLDPLGIALDESALRTIIAEAEFEVNAFWGSSSIY